MADISQQINAINSARYGEEVRGSIVTALTAVNDQVEADETSAGASATAAAASAAEAAATEARLASAVEAAEQTEADIEAAEALRVTAEEGRVNAENARVAAEQARENAETGYVAQAQAAAAQAQQYASSDYVKTAQSWAVGGTSSRYGEDTNNSKYWAEVAAQVVTEGGVGSFNGRTGQVLPEAGDYDTTMVSRGTGTVETALASIESGIGSTALPTTAQTITGAIAEHESDISQLNSKLTQSGIQELAYAGSQIAADANSLPDGIAYLGGGSTNVPEAYIIVLTWSTASYKLQLGFPMGGAFRLYQRRYASGTWSAWYYVGLTAL